MREIKFRGKRVDNGERIYGDLAHCFDTYISDDKNLVDDISRGWVKVVDESVGQFTGLKDKNGVEIYEGDRVRCWGGEYSQGYWEHDTIIEIKDMINDCFMMGEHEFLEVVK